MLESCQDWQTAGELAQRLRMNQTQLEKLLANLAARQLLERQPLTPPSNGWPTVSIIVPVRNRPDEIVACVRSLQKLDYPATKLEIIVVDDASTDNTIQVVKNLPISHAICRPVWSGPAACRNAGAAIATGEILAYTDSDCEVEAGWLRDLIPHFADQDIGIVGGRVNSFSLDTSIERYESVASSLYMGQDERDCRPNTSIPFLPTANLLIRRELWQALGGFDPAFPIGEDVDLVWRAHQSDKRVLYVPRGTVRHKYRSRLVNFARRKAFYGGSETFLLRKHPLQRKILYIPRQRLPFIALLLTAVVNKKIGLVAVAASVPLIESGFSMRRLQKFGAHIGWSLVFKTVLRNYDVMFFHVCGNLARYYGLGLVGLGLLCRPLLALTLFCFAYPTLHVYLERKPPLSLPVFAALYWLELVAHQVGMFRRCLECRTLRPLIPTLRV